MKLSNEQEGAFYAALAYLLWGIIPIYWKWLDQVSAGEILAHRVVWSFVFMICLLLLTRKWPQFLLFLKEIKNNRKKFWVLLTASLLITGNWGIFIWAVNSNHLLQTSLGYYINPLVSVLLGVVVLKEKLSGAQIFAFSLAGIGVLILTLHFGAIPWVALSLAMTFALYGLAKKLISADSSVGLTLETMMVTPLALGYLVYILFSGSSAFTGSISTGLLLMGGGVVTALPLLYFAKGAQKIPLSMLGLLQYIAPTLQLILGVFLYHESFTKVHLLAFMFIWSALVVYSLSRVKWFGKRTAKPKSNYRIGA
ncbi:EamA family transporter RarD [Peribacillus saganii]|uniref:EamA family transporter RarD n=1 Tax=Peribacillus saganii TaxID=2303992 RepID=A0A372LJK6_9BACI|nr:EamA family transporter RarD [Peribacillus saganii]RFU66149.1 EamA family transporter RarD [Peribacillus saganii]